VQYMGIYGIRTSSSISLRLHVAKVYNGGSLPNFLHFNKGEILQISEHA
jgi:hypothetical protein